VCNAKESEVQTDIRQPDNNPSSEKGEHPEIEKEAKLEITKCHTPPAALADPRATADEWG
jgi:hypothetical protein